MKRHLMLDSHVVTSKEDGARTFYQKGFVYILPEDLATELEAAGKATDADAPAPEPPTTPAPDSPTEQ